MTSHLNSHRTTDIKPEMLSGVQTRNGTPHDEYNIHTWHCPCANKQKTRHFHAKTTSANLYMFIGVGQGTCEKSRPYPARAYTTAFLL